MLNSWLQISSQKLFRTLEFRHDLRALAVLEEKDIAHIVIAIIFCCALTSRLNYFSFVPQQEHASSHARCYVISVAILVQVFPEDHPR